MIILGTCWDVFWETVGRFLDRFGMFPGKRSAEVGKTKFSDLSGSIFPGSGRSKQLFLAGPGQKIQKKRNCDFLKMFIYFSIQGSAA